MMHDPRLKPETGFRRSIRIPVLLALLALVTLALVPMVVQHRVSGLRYEITDVADPAIRYLAHVNLQLSVEAAARRGYLLSGDAELERRARTARARRQAAQDSVRVLARLLGGMVAAEMSRLDRGLSAADREVDSLFATRVAAPRSGGGLVEREQRTDAARAEVERVAGIFHAAAERRRTAIQRAEEAGQAVSLVLVVIALAAAAIVVRIAQSYRALGLRLDQALTDEKRSRDAAEQRQRSIEQVTASRTRLIRGFTHDVKNPLGAADGYLALLADGVMGELQASHRQTVERARRSIDNALRLIGELLDLARAEAGELEIERAPTFVDRIAEEVADEFRAQAAGKQQTLTVHPAGAARITSDPRRVGQIIGNLLSNAIKYTQAGGRITLTVSQRPEWVLVTVADDGPGIAAERVALLFEEFTRFDPAAADGAGIGLAISQKLARMLGGEITVETAPGQGSRFTLELPHEAPERRHHALPDRRPSKRFP